MARHISSHPTRHAPGQSVYERYLRTEELLSLQKPESELLHHDELQFQIVHQVFELWWKESAFELRTIQSLLREFNLGFSRFPQNAGRWRRHRLTRLPRLDDALSPAVG